jgi:hypothetical protein
MVVQSYK